MKLLRTAFLVSFFDLSPEWQQVALTNFDTAAEAEQQRYIEPDASHVPNEHILFDLNECVITDRFGIDAVIPISNACALGIKFIDEDNEEVEIYSL